MVGELQREFAAGSGHQHVDDGSRRSSMMMLPAFNPLPLPCSFLVETPLDLIPADWFMGVRLCLSRRIMHVCMHGQGKANGRRGLQYAQEDLKRSRFDENHVLAKLWCVPI